MINTLKIAVRDLVQHVLRSGDLELEFFGSSRTVDAIRAHQAVQQSRPKHYQAEVPVAHLVECPPFSLHISGRIDGVFTATEDNPDLPTIEEIKTTTQNLTVVADAANPLHWGQAKVYAYLYARAHHFDRIVVQLTYVQLESGQHREIKKLFGIDDLSDFVHALVATYVQWAETVIDWMQRKERSIARISFPFATYRTGQRQMAVAVYRAVQQNFPLIVQAATGIGKTMAAVFPTVKAMAEGNISKLFYLTARTTTRTVAEATFDLLRTNGLKFKTLTLTAKDKICFRPEAACSADECEYAKGYHDRIQAAVADIFQTDAFTQTEVERFARAHQVCPFEFSLELSLWADAVICDYNYAFDPRVYLRRFFADGTDDYVFLIDEAHNLVDRSREMFSAAIEKQAFLDLRRAIRSDLPRVHKVLGRINAQMLAARRRCDGSGGTFVETSPPETLSPLLKEFLFATEKWLVKNRKTPFREDLLTVYFDTMAFIRVLDRYDTSYATTYQRIQNDLRVKLFCIDPSRQLKEALQRCRTALFYSATMTPAAYFKKMFGCGDDTEAIALPSPFPTDNLGVFILDRISTYYRHRQKTATDVTLALTQLVRVKKGNYLFFFPSYQYLQLVLAKFAAHNPDLETISQTPDMSETQRAAFLHRFSEDNADWLIGFAVMGGIFGEGIDLVGDRLSGAAVVGVGLPAICPERELIREYFATHDEAGFEFAYIYPGINRVLQAAGRVIRSERDRGVVMLMDQRFGTTAYQALLPREWTLMRVRTMDDLAACLRQFW